MGEASELRSGISLPKGRVAIAVVDGSGTVDLALDRGVEGRLFEAGSLTKVFTATLLAALVIDGSVSQETEVGEILGGDAGAAADVTLQELATHTSGLPRLAPNAMRFPFWPRDPYRFYGRRRLIDGLARVALTDRGTAAYSNLGFGLLGHCLSRATGQSMKRLLEERVFAPAGMETARCQPCARHGLLRGRGNLMLGGARWHEPLPGAGGVDCSITDLAQWARANVIPSSTPLEAAVTLAHAEGLAWQRAGTVLWHNGATGCFQAMVAIAWDEVGVAALATASITTGYAIDRPIMEWMKKVEEIG